MLSFRLASVAGLFLLITAEGPSFGQTFSDVARQLDAADAMTKQASPGIPVHIQVAYQLKLPANPSATLDEQVQGFTAAHKAIYELAAHECDQLMAVTPGECRMVSVTIGQGGMPYNGQGATLQVAGSAMFELTPRPVAPPSEAKPAP